MKFEKKQKSILYGMEITHGVRRALMGALALVYFLSFGFSVVSVTTVFAISSIIMMLCEFPTGAIADYDSRKKSLMISFLLMSVAFFGLFIFKSFWLLALSWVLGDIAWTFSSGAGSAWIVDTLNYAKEKSKIVKMISQEYIFERGGHIIGGLIGLVVVAINFSFVWLLVSLSNLFMFFIIWIYMEERNFTPEKVPHGYVKKSLIKARESYDYLIHKDNKELRTLMVGGFMGVLAVGSFFVGVPIILTQSLGLNPEHLSGLHALLAFFALGSPLIIEKVANKKGFRVSLFSFFVIISLSILAFSLTQSLIVAVAALAIFTMIETGSDIIEESAQEHEFDSKIRASLGSVSSINWSIANSIAVFLAGLGIQFLGLTITMSISAGLAFLTSLVYLLGMVKE